MDSIDVLFVCLHGSAKSVIAAELFRREAAARGLAMTTASAGIEADEAVPAGVAAGLAAEGIDVSSTLPRQLTGAIVASARRVVALGCRIDETGYALPDLRRWDDIPPVSDGFEPARDVILDRVSALLDELA